MVLGSCRDSSVAVSARCPRPISLEYLCWNALEMRREIPEAFDLLNMDWIPVKCKSQSCS